MPGRIRTEVSGAIGTIVFDQVERHNAVSVEMWRAIPAAARRLAEDDAVRVVVLRGAGDDAFIAGADISEFEGERRGDARAGYDADSAAAFLALESIDKPLVAAIRGFCVGGGVAIALTADLRFANDDASFSLPAAKLGLGYHVSGIAALARVVGLSSAKELFFTARRIDAREALDMHFVNAVFPTESFDADFDAIVQRIARAAPLTLRAVKLAAKELAKPESVRDFSGAERAVRACFDSKDYAEGVRAFLEKRPPKFVGE